jgi:hypothetical protein
MTMHHNALCISCTTLVNYGHLLHIRIDHAEPESKFQEEQVRWVFEGQQVSSCEDANIVVIKTRPGASNHHT